MGTTRFPNGISTNTKAQPLSNYGAPDPTKYITFFEDFASHNSFPLATSGLAAAATNTWTVTVTEAGTSDASAAMADVNGGAVTITTDNADNDLVFAQRKGESYLMAAGKKSFFKAKFSVTDANANAASILNTEWYFGLMVTDTDPLSATGGDGVTDGIFFMSEDGTQDIKFYVQKNTTTGQKATTLTDTLTVATSTEFAFAFDGARYVEIFVNGVKKTTVDLSATLSAYLPDTELTVSFGVKNGEAVSKVMTVDYIFAAQER